MEFPEVKNNGSAARLPSDKHQTQQTVTSLVRAALEEGIAVWFGVYSQQ
jgi:hypothetical protein